MLLLLHVIPAQDPAFVTRSANEDLSGFGPLGPALLVGAPLALALSAPARGADRRRIALALALPVYIVLLALTAKYNIWITRFLIVPVVLTAPLFGGIFRNRLAALAAIAVAGATIGLTLADDANKKLDGRFGRPWNLSQVQALEEFAAQPTGKIVAASLAAYDRLVPPPCVRRRGPRPGRAGVPALGADTRAQGVLLALADSAEERLLGRPRDTS